MLTHPNSPPPRAAPAAKVARPGGMHEGPPPLVEPATTTTDAASTPLADAQGERERKRERKREGKEREMIVRTQRTVSKFQTVSTGQCYICRDFPMEFATGSSISTDQEFSQHS